MVEQSEAMQVLNIDFHWEEWLPAHVPSRILLSQWLRTTLTPETLSGLKADSPAGVLHHGIDKNLFYYPDDLLYWCFFNEVLLMNSVKTV